MSETAFIRLSGLILGTVLGNPGILETQSWKVDWERWITVVCNQK